MGARFSLIIVGILGIYAFLFVNLYKVQVIQGERYFAEAQSQYSAIHSASGERGSIYFTDKDGKLTSAALTKDFPIIYAVPKEIDDAQESANRLASILGSLPGDFIKMFSSKSPAFAVIQKKADPDLAAKVEEANIKGVHSEEAPARFYPFGFLASQVLGFVGPDPAGIGESGKYGVEKMYDGTLSGAIVQKDETGFSVSQPGGNVALTIDPAIEAEAEHVLQPLVEKFHAKSGTVIVEEPLTGKILAMGSTPRYDPNNYSTAQLSSFLNPAVEKTYEPGSVVKVLTMSAGIDTGHITPQTSFYDSGVLKVSGKTIQDWDHKNHGLITMTNVIEQSLNVGAAFAERQMGDTIFKNYLSRFGFGEKSGIDLPGEVSGSLRQLGPHAPAVAYATASFGQGISATPLQVINAIAAIANGGKLMRPYLNADMSPKVLRQVMTPETAQMVGKMMISAVDKNVIGHIDGFQIAGKTGTAQVPDLVHGGYYPDKVINPYVGFGPVSDPRFIILMKIEEPDNAPLAGLTVVPAFRELAQFLINYYNIPPDKN